MDCLRSWQPCCPSPDIVKVGVAVHDDIKALRHLEPFEPGGFVDLQTVVAAHGIKQLGLKKLSAIILGFSISKSQQTSNWEAPGLTAASAGPMLPLTHGFAGAYTCS
ncbi:MAG: hypothetical protein MZV63_45295 [Marinilabiliales bacterium]|nr:hypothetical protein [Marinilabiliales bacterium]